MGPGGRVVALAALVLLPWPRAAAQAPAASGAEAQLEVEATGFRSSRGHAIARLYRPGEDVVGEPWRQARADLHGGRAQLVFAALPPGRYAVVVFHDLDDDGAIGHTVLRLPAEPLGFSGGFVLGLFSGKPTFEKLGFELRAGSTTLAVTVR
jgi:uncharacterized protein (DUF2141 family)